MSIDRRYYVYTLSRPPDADHPKGSVFYVGKGSRNRPKQHSLEALRGCSCGKCHSIRDIWQEGGNVLTTFVFESDDEQAVFDYETQLIRHYGLETVMNFESRAV